MALPEGAAARGKAGIFGTSINPLQVYMQQNAGREKMKAQQAEAERKQRDDMIADLRKFDPGKVWEPFYGEVNDMVQKNVRDFSYDALERGVPAQNFQRELDRRKGDVLANVNKVNWLKTQFEDINKRIDDDEYLKKDYYHSKVNDRFFDGIHARPSSEIRTDDLENIFDDPEGYNTHAIVTDFMKSLPEKVNQKWTEYWGQLGQQYNIQETKTKLGFQQDANGNVILDPRTGQPKVQMTDDVYLQAVENPYLSKIVDHYLPNGTDKQKRVYLQQLLEGQDPKSIQNRPQLGFKLDQKDRWSNYNGLSFSGDVDPKQVYDRFKAVDQTWNQVNPGYLQHMFEPFENTRAFYVDASGKETTDQSAAKKIKIEFPDKGKVRLNAMMQEMIMFDDSIPTDKKKQAIQELEGYLAKKEFDLSSKNDRLAYHFLTNRLLDGFDTKKNAYGDDYRRVVEKEIGYDNQTVVPKGKVR